MMEQSDSCKCHDHLIFITALYYQVVPDRSSGLGDITDAAFVSPFDVVGKGEECVGTKRDILHLLQPGAFLFSCENRRFYFKDMFPDTVCQDIHIFFSDVNINGVVALCTSQRVYKLQSKYLRRLPKEPVVGFIPCKSGAVNAGLLAGSDANSLSVFYIADRIGLGIF